MPATLLSELLVGFGKAKQTDLVTGSSSAGIWRLGNISRAFANPRQVNESNAAWLGKGHEFATQLFKSHVEGGPHSMEKYTGSEFAAWLWSFGLGKVVKTGVGPFSYTCTPLVPASDGIEQPSFSYCEQMRPGANVVVDRLLVGCVVRSFEVNIARGPGLANSVSRLQFTHSGKTTEPSGITMPAETSENLLNAYSAAVTILGEDYITLKTFESLTMGWDNAHRDGFYPGSGQQDAYQIQGRIELGDRVPNFSFIARLHKDSPELAAVRALTSGVATVALTKDANNSMTVTWHDMAFQSADFQDAEGITTVAVVGIPKYHSVNGVVTAVVVTPVDGIAQ